MRRRRRARASSRRDYTKYLKADALKGARIGIARDFLGADPDVDWVVDASLDAMRRPGATIVDVRYPKWLLDAKEEFYNAIRRPGVSRCRSPTTWRRSARRYPKTLDADDRARRTIRTRTARGRRRARTRAVGRCSSAKRRAARSDDYRYTVGSRSRPADGARRRRRHARGAEARRDRLSDVVAAAGPDRRDRRQRRRRRRRRRRPTSRT